MCQDFCFQLVEKTLVLRDISICFFLSISRLRDFLPVTKRPHRFPVVHANRSEVGITSAAPTDIELMLRQPCHNCADVLHGAHTHLTRTVAAGH